jgi:hypothetical protein
MSDAPDVPRRGGLIHGVTPLTTPRLAARMDLRGVSPRAGADWHHAVTSWAGCKNDVLGTCVEAMMLHSIQARIANGRGYQYNPPDQLAVDLYTKLTGYDPVTGQNDIGTPMPKAMAYWAHDGIKLGDQLEDVCVPVSINPRNLDEIKLGVDFFVGVGLSLALPLYSQSVTTIFDVPASGVDSAQGRPGGWDGHEVFCGRYEENIFYVISWGQEFAMSPEFIAAYCTAVDTGMSPLALDTNDQSPDQLTRAQVFSKMTMFA